MEGDVKRGFCIYVNSICEGATPVEFDGNGKPFIYPTESEAQKAIAEYTIDRLQQFLAGERDFGDAMTVEEYVVDVDVLPDGSISDESGQCFG